MVKGTCFIMALASDIDHNANSSGVAKFDSLQSAVIGPSAARYPAAMVAAIIKSNLFHSSMVFSLKKKIDKKLKDATEVALKLKREAYPFEHMLLSVGAPFRREHFEALDPLGYAASPKEKIPLTLYGDASSRVRAGFTGTALKSLDSFILLFVQASDILR